MEYQEFLQKLSETPRDWCFDDGNRIRYKGEPGHKTRPLCPANRVMGFPTLCELSTSDVILWSEIVRAADWSEPTAVRTDLLKACGLTEVA